MNTLSTKHREELEVGSGISPELIEARGYHTTLDVSRLAALGFNDTQRRVPALMIPLYRPGQKSPAVYQIKPTWPRKDDKGKVLKYEYPFGNPPVLDTAPVELMHKALFEGKDEVWITEGTKKSDSAVSHGIPCMALSGVWSWRSKNKHGVRVILPELDTVDWQDRPVNLCFDNDIMEKESVYWALVRFSGVLQQRGAKVRYAILPPGEAKGLDDWLVAGGARIDLERLSKDTLPEPPNRFYTGNDAGMASRVRDAMSDFMFWDNHNGLWYVWNGELWVPDRQGNHARRFILEHVDVIREEAKGLSDEVVPPYKLSARARHNLLANKYGDYNALSGCERVMRSLMATDHAGVNSNPDLLCLKNGTLELDSGLFREHRPADRLTIMANVAHDPDADCPLWKGFMEDRFPNEETRAFVQRMCGLFLTGNSPEKAFFILQGEKDCGKSVFIELIHWLLGGYANKVDKATLTKGKGGDGKALERASELVGKRYVYVDESGHKDEIDDAFIKEMTGGEATIKSRRLYEQPEESKAEFTLVLATNFKPRMTGMDDAAWRRCRLIHFGESIPADMQILNFQSMLREEGSGILNWMFEGYRQWKAIGLQPPEEVTQWTANYQDENDPVGQFVRECYDVGAEVDGFVPSGTFSAHYHHWAMANEINVKTMADASQLSRHIKQRWPVTKDGPRRSNQRGFYHMKEKEAWRGQFPTEDEVMEI